MLCNQGWGWLRRAPVSAATAVRIASEAQAAKGGVVDAVPTPPCVLPATCFSLGSRRQLWLAAGACPPAPFRHMPHLGVL